VIFEGTRVGTARLFISEDRIDAFLNEALRANVRRVGLIALVVILFSIVAAFGIARAMAVPINRIVEGMREVAEGRLIPIDFPARSDELGWMGEELNVTIQKLKELDAMKRDFVSGITHDFKSPLTAIQNAAELLGVALPDSAKNSATVSDSLLSLRNNADRLQHFVAQLLELARIEKGIIPIVREEFDVMALTNKVVALYQTMAKQKGVELRLSGPPSLVVNCDPDKIDQVISNLISNSLKFTHRGSIRLSWSENGAANSTQASIVRFDIEDTGEGIPKDKQRMLFDKFYHTDPMQKEKTNAGPSFPKGTGLGLSIVKGWVEALGGKVWIESAGPGRGTTVSFTLPRRPS
jgi:signal transduction histidine kinase